MTADRGEKKTQYAGDLGRLRAENIEGKRDNTKKYISVAYHCVNRV